jgi:hypothetical protein
VKGAALSINRAKFKTRSDYINLAKTAHPHIGHFVKMLDRSMTYLIFAARDARLVYSALQKYFGPPESGPISRSFAMIGQPRPNRMAALSPSLNRPD